MEMIKFSKAETDIIPLADECIYTSCYCEENVWQLCYHIKNTSPEELNKYYVVFISNENKTVPLWCQKASKTEDGLVIWDYHVILIKKNDQSLVYDLDSKFPFPYDYIQYAMGTFRSDQLLKVKFHRKFRVIEAELFLKLFASDRSHMLQSSSGKWLKPPPTYPCIQTPNSSNNLPEFINMDPDIGLGHILTLDQLMKTFNN